MNRLPHVLLLALLMSMSLPITGCSDNNETTPPVNNSKDMGTDSASDESKDDSSSLALTIPKGCNPVAFEHDCTMPFPSNVFLEDDANMPSGKRVDISPGGQPVTKSGVPFNPFELHPADGFSPLMPILSHFPEGVDLENVNFHPNGGDATLAPTSTTLLINAETGALVAHWAELDEDAASPADQAFIVRPFARLKEKTRYIVAFQGLKDAQKQPIVAPNGFRHLRDKIADPALEEIAGRYEQDIFPVLKSAGVKREDVQLAWDFTTKSMAHTTGDMLEMRADLIERLEKDPIEVTLGEVNQNPSDNVALEINGTMKVPLYMESAESHAMINRDDQGKVAFNGMTDVPFLIQVPPSAMPDSDDFTPARIVQYGHGFFGTRDELTYSFPRRFGQEQGVILAAVNWWGMDESDFVGAAKGLNDPGTTFRYTDRIHQGILNQIALSYALKDALTKVEVLQRAGKSLYDPAHLYYYGISQGQIFGTAFIAQSPHIERAVMSVGAASFSFMMSRSNNFAPFLALLKNKLTRLNLQKFIAMSQSPYDRVDPVTYTDHLLTGDYPNTPAKRSILMQIGLGDTQVTNVASYMQARTMGLKLLTPSPASPWGIQTTQGPTDSAMVLVDFKLDPLPGVYYGIPEAVEGAPSAHNGVREVPALRDQIDAFMQPDGMITHTCMGPCLADSVSVDR